MDLIEISGKVLGVQDATNGTFFWVQTEAGLFEQLYNQEGKFDFIEVGTTGTFYADGLPIWNPVLGNWGVIPRVIKFEEGNLYNEDYWDDDKYQVNAKKGGKE